MNGAIDYFVKNLGLIPHPEGGFYRETYRSETLIEPFHKGEEKNISTGIYFLLTEGNFSAFHRIKSDEMLHFYAGAHLVVHVINTQGEYYTLKIGLDLEHGQVPQAIIPAGSWFASETSGVFSLIGCTVSPGFDYKDFELAKQSELSQLYPTHSSTIKRLTRI